MLVVSPTSVAAPCRLEDTAMAVSTGTGEIFSFRAIASPTGATIKTVATLSTKALMTPAKSASIETAHLTFGTRAISSSARRSGIRLSMKRATVPIVPASMSSTLKSMARAASRRENSQNPAPPNARNPAAPPNAIHGRYCGSPSIRRYVQTKRHRARSIDHPSGSVSGFASVSSSIIR